MRGIRVDVLARPNIEAPNEGALRTRTFAWLLADIVPQGDTLADLGAGPCIFAKRAWEAGYRVTAVDGRDERVPDDLPDGIEFVQADVRSFPLDGFDVIALLGLLYHLTLAEQRDLMLRANAARTVIVDTQIHIPTDVTGAAGSWAQKIVTTENGYEGVLFPEGKNPMASIGNPTSFWHTLRSAFQLFEEANFGTCLMVEPGYVSKYGARRFFVLN